MSHTPNNALEELVDSTVSIPTIPSTLVELKKVCASERSAAADIAAVIERDPAVAAKVLRLVNSSFYGMSHRVTAIPVACTILGRRVIQNVVLQATVLETFGAETSDNQNDASGFDVDDLWDHSFKTAVATQSLVSKTKHSVGLSRDDAYTCGLMHDVGKVILHQNLPEDFARAVTMSSAEGIPLARAEHAVFGFTHADVGGLLAGTWKLSDELASAIQFHHDPGVDSKERVLGLFVHVASSLAHEVASKQPNWRPDFAKLELVQKLGISDADLDEIRDLVAATKLD